MSCVRVCLALAVFICWSVQPASADQAGDTDQEAAGQHAGGEWVRGRLNTIEPVWGRRGGLVFGVQPVAQKNRQPRGLIALGYPTREQGQYELVNFIAVEPVVNGRRGFSELEMSRLDEVRGRRIWASAKPGDAQSTDTPEQGMVRQIQPGVEQLDVLLRVERFDNGAHVFLTLSQRSDTPDEVRIAIHAEPDCAAMQSCILTATMGNKARTRLLWLNDEVLDSRRLYADYRESGFAAHTVISCDRLHRARSGDVLVALTTDEDDPAAVFPFPGTRLWHYDGAVVTQYWRKPRGTLGDDLRAAVNARYTYWQSKQPVPGGVAYENFELRAPFSDGQCFVFGITRRTPNELGFRASRPMNAIAPPDLPK